MEATNSPSNASPAAVLDAARQELIEETVRGSAGRIAAERYADRVDTLVQRLFFEASPPQTPVAILALGGYGRRHLTLHSDVDVLVLFAGPIGAAEERFLRGFLHPLWDLPIVVGHQVRELADFARLETDNPEFLLALLDARRIVGDPALHNRFVTAFHGPEAHATILELLQHLIDERHVKFNGTLYQLEPDTKDAPGALRDLLAVRTIARLTDPALLGHGPADPARLDEAEDFLLRVRSIVHLERKRNQNVLSHDLQEKAAQTLGYAGAQPQQRPVLGYPDSTGRHFKCRASLLGRQPGQHPQDKQLTLVHREAAQQRPGALRLQAGYHRLLRPWLVIGTVRQVLRGNRQPGRRSPSVGNLMGRNAEDKGGKRPAHILIPRQSGKDGDTDLLRHVLGNMVPARHVGEPGAAVPDHHRPDLPEQRVDGGRLAPCGQFGQVGDRRGRVVVADSLLNHAFPLRRYAVTHQAVTHG